jgi:hypothetical protein
MFVGHLNTPQTCYDNPSGKRIDTLPLALSSISNGIFSGPDLGQARRQITQFV